MHKIIIPIELPSMNEMIASAKKGSGAYQPYAEMKREYTNICAIFTRKAVKKPISNPVILHITWYCKNKKKDMDNVAAGKKFIFDGLQKSGVLKNDGWGEIKGWEECFKVDKENPRVEILVEEVER